jgi:uncharacterized protein Usg
MNRVAHLTLLASVGLVPLAAFDAEAIDIHGFVSQGFLYSSDNNWVANTADGTLQFNEAALNVSADLTDDLRAGVQFFAYDLGPVGNNKMAIDWAYLDYRYNQQFGLRAGRTKIRNGLYNEYMDVDAVRPTILLPAAAYYQLSFREAALAANGAQIYGNIDAGSGGDLDYQAMIGTMSLDPDSSIGMVIRNEGIDSISTMDSKLTYNLGLTWNTPLEGLKASVTYTHIDEIAASGQTAVSFDGSVIDPGLTGIPITTLDVAFSVPDYDIWIGSLEYTWQDLTLAAEYRYIKRDITNSSSVDLTGYGAGVIGLTNNAYTEKQDGYYLQASYLLDDQWTVSAYYSFFNTDTGDRNSDNPGKRFQDIALAVRCDINEYWNAKAEVHFIDGYGIDGIASSADDGSKEEDWTLFALKTTLSF